MDSLPFIVPIAGVVFLANALWSCTLGCRVRHLQRRVELLEDERAAVRLQAVREKLEAAAVLPQQVPVYYPPIQTQMGAPPPYRPMPMATAPPAVSFQRV